MHPWLLLMTTIGMMKDITFNRQLAITTLSPRFILIRNPRYIPIILSPGLTIIILPKIRIMVTTGDTAMAAAMVTAIAIFVATSMTTMTNLNLKKSVTPLCLVQGIISYRKGREGNRVNDSPESCPRRCTLICWLDYRTDSRGLSDRVMLSLVAIPALYVASTTGGRHRICAQRLRGQWLLPPVNGSSPPMGQVCVVAFLIADGGQGGYPDPPSHSGDRFTLRVRAIVKSGVWRIKRPPVADLRFV
jgi:hypothetical protein